MTTMKVLTPVEVIAPEGAQTMTILWNDGTESLLRNEVLRGFCPCALCQGHHGPIEWVESSSASSTELADLKEVGNYAIELAWKDGHQTGIYTFVYLKRLGALWGRKKTEICALRFEHQDEKSV